MKATYDFYEMMFVDELLQAYVAKKRHRFMVNDWVSSSLKDSVDLVTIPNSGAMQFVLFIVDMLKHSCINTESPKDLCRISSLLKMDECRYH